MQPGQRPTPKKPAPKLPLALLYGVLVALFLLLQSVVWPAEPDFLARQFRALKAQATNHDTGYATSRVNEPPPRPPRTRLTNPLGGNVTFSKLVGRAIKLIMGVSGSLALLMFVYGGFVWTTAGGNPEKIKQGKNIFIWAVIGIFFIFISYALLNALFGALGLQ